MSSKKKKRNKKEKKVLYNTGKRVEKKREMYGKDFWDEIICARYRDEEHYVILWYVTWTSSKPYVVVK